MTTALRTISAMLDDAAAAGEDRGVAFVHGERPDLRLSYAGLRERVHAVAQALLADGLARGERVALVLPEAVEFVPLFLGIVAAGGVAVPLAHPASRSNLGPWLERAGGLLAASGARRLVADDRLRPLLGTLTAAAPTLGAVLGPGALAGDAAAFRDPGVGLDDVAMLQFTSGSTAQPKGVTLTHGNLAANCRAITDEGLAIEPADCAVSWLPLFHDMGLIGFVLAPLSRAVPLVHFPPQRFLRRPALWLQLLSAHRGTITYAPNFAYAFATRRVEDGELAGVDLSHVRIRGCGAEPIQAETLRAFARRFAAQGLSAEAFTPSYGMAESTLAISFARGLAVDRIRRAPFADAARAEPAAAGEEDAIEFVDCGRPFAGHELAIVEPGGEAVLPERRVGEIRVRGPSVMRGYWGNPEATSATFDAEGRLRTGDLGYLAGGRVHVCGRLKDLIIVRGRNYAPQDLEWAAAGVDGVRAGCVVAFAIGSASAEAAESVVIVAESRSGDGTEGIAQAVAARVAQAVGLRPDEVLIVPPHTIPKTSSGKLQRSAVRAAYLGSTLAPPAREGLARTAARYLSSQLSYVRSALARRIGR